MTVNSYAALAIHDELVTLRELADDLDSVLKAGVAPSSQMAQDNRAAVVGPVSVAFTSYVQNRAENASRFAHEVHRSAGRDQASLNLLAYGHP